MPQDGADPGAELHGGAGVAGGGAGQLLGGGGAGAAARPAHLDPVHPGGAVPALPPAGGRAADPLLPRTPRLHSHHVPPPGQLGPVPLCHVTPRLPSVNMSTVRPSKSGSKSCQTWPFLFSKYGYQELVCTRTSGWLYPCVHIHMVIAW